MTKEEFENEVKECEVKIYLARKDVQLVCDIGGNSYVTFNDMIQNFVDAGLENLKARQAKLSSTNS